MTRSLAFIAPAAAVLAATAVHAAPAQDLQATLDAHFQAVQTRDLAALERTLTEGEALELYLPNGKRTATKAEFLAFHVEWFKQTTWTMRFEPVSRIVTDDMAVVTVRTRYEDVDEGKPYWSESWLTLVFERQRGGWRLVHDQNTRIRTSNDAAS